MQDVTILKETLEKLDIPCSDHQAAQTMQYIALLVEWNKKIDLTAVPDEQILDRHVINSLTPSTEFDFRKYKTLIDVGTGAGLPGIPLKIFFPHLEVTLLDSLNKRINFLNLVIAELKLDGIKAIHGRAEELAKAGQPFRESYDIAIARAVARLPVLIELLLPLVKPGGYALAMKGRSVKDELADCKQILSAVGGKIENLDKISGNSSDEVLAKISKISPSHKEYPRNYKLIKQDYGKTFKIQQ